jgi:hypothetical protein
MLKNLLHDGAPMKQGIVVRSVIRTLAELGDAITLAPERHRAASLEGAGREKGGVSLGTLVTLRNERVSGDALGGAIVFDTTHAKDGVLDVAAALRMTDVPSSAKKRVRPGDLLVSRLRPYLRQIAFAHPAAMAACGDRVVACSTEFYVLAPTLAPILAPSLAPSLARNSAGAASDAASLAYLVPWLLAAPAQAILAAGQEGGHHPRVPRETLLAMRVPKGIVARRSAVSRDVEAALNALYFASDAYARLLARC